MKTPDWIKRLLGRRVLASLFFGSLAFILLTGGSIFLPSNDQWLMIGDAAQHQIGWEFFRTTPIFQWPVGLNPSLGLVFSSSIVFTDSIPLASFLFKPFSIFLGSSFQYFGLWIWLCFVLQYHFAYRIISKFSTEQLTITLSSLFFVISPPFLYRMIHEGSGHIALVSHFLILAAIDLYLDHRLRLKSWIILLSAGVFIQAYFVPMLLAIWGASLVRNVLSKRQGVRQASNQLFSALGVLLFVAWAAGYFVVGSSFNPAGWDYVFRWQPLSLVDSGTDGSTGWSYLFRNTAQLAGDTEAFSYLGSGLLLLAMIVSARQLFVSNTTRSKVFQVSVSASPLIAALAVSIFRKTIELPTFFNLASFLSLVSLLLVAGWKQFKPSSGVGVISYQPLIISCLLLGIYSMTNKVGLGTRQFFEYPLLPGLKEFTQTFRTHGRFIWPAFYGISLLIIIGSFSMVPKKLRSAVLTAALLLQFADSTRAFNGVRERFTNTPVWTSQLKDPQWDIWARQYKKILVVPPLNNDKDDLWLSITEYAASNDMSTNSGNFSRFDSRLYDRELLILANSLFTKEFSHLTLYIILDQKVWNRIRNLGGDLQTQLFSIDGLNVFAP
jgi:hypothetical protein